MLCICNGSSNFLIKLKGLNNDEYRDYTKLPSNLGTLHNRAVEYFSTLILSREYSQKGKFADCYPHQLVMTATPIPRTLAMTAYADLETSVIDELPPGRTPITTVALPDTRRDDIIERVKLACNDQGRQVYWVCTLIDESEVLQCQAAEDSALQLKEALPELSVGLVHGRMKSAEKQAIMSFHPSGKSW